MLFPLGPLAFPHCASTKSIVGETPEALAYALIWPTAMLADYKENGPPQSWEECMFDIALHHGFQAQYWLDTFGEHGKQNPTQLEQWANRMMALYREGTLGSWVVRQSAYQQFCAQFGGTRADADSHSYTQTCAHT